MRNAFALFGLITALNTLVTGIWLWFAFEADRGQWAISLSRDVYLWVHRWSYALLVCTLAIIALLRAHDKWKNRHV